MSQMNEINAIAISGTQPLDIEHYFAINFEELNDSINKLSDRTTELTNEDKALAVQVIETWNRDVINTIDRKINEVNRFCISFNLTTQDIQMSDDEIGAIAQHLHFDREYDAYMEAWRKYLSLRKECQYIKDKYADIERTPQNKELLGKFSAEKYKNTMEISKSRKECDRITTDLFVKMAKTDEVKNFLKKGRQFLSQASDIKKEAVNKAQRAKINVTIDNKNVKDALFELLAFSI